VSPEWKISVSPRILRLPPYLFATINKVKYEKRRQGVDVIDLGMGNPTDPPPALVVEKLCEAVHDPRNHRYSASIGVFNLRREVSRLYEKLYNVSLDPETEVIATIGSKEGFSHLCLALLGAGDTALVPTPWFPIHVYGVVLAGATAINIPVGTDESFLRRAVDVIENLQPRPKLWVLNYPHNPTTATVELGFFEEVVAIARKYKLLVVQDLAYGETVFDGYKAPSILQVKGAKDLAVEFTTMSKAFNMAGWRIGFCSGNAEMVRALAMIKHYYDYGIFQPIQIAAIIALRHCTEYAEQQARLYQSRRDVLCKGLGRLGWEVPKPRATMFVWAPIPRKFRSMGSFEFCLKLIQEAAVAASPGAGFGENGEGHLRFALVENELRLKQAVRQIGRLFSVK
jgi:alanine-synthesizing transaminase